MWIQIIIRQNIKTYHSHATGKHVNFYEAANEFMEKVLAPYTRSMKDDAKVGSFAKMSAIPKQLEPVIKAVSDQLGQLHYDCGIRILTLSDKRICSEDQFNNLRRDARLIFRQYAQPYANEFNRINSTQFDAPWSDPTGLALDKIKKHMLDFYRLRTFFHPPLQYSIKYPAVLSMFFPSNKPETIVLSGEELATIFHFPGMVSETPSFKRIESKIAKPPSNLPI